MGHPTLLKKEDSLLLVIDMQEKLLPAISNRDQVIKNIRLLLEGAKILQVPFLLTEQYSKGLGKTVSPILESSCRPAEIDKLTFSCCGDSTFSQKFSSFARKQIVICGIETQICVLQTTLDLLSQGFQCHVVSDAVGSRFPENRSVALERIRSQGAMVTCVESVLFEWLKASGSEEFKSISKLIR